MGLSPFYGIIASLIFMSPSIIAYYVFISDSSLEIQLMMICCIGSLLYWSEHVEAGTEEELLFFGGKTGRFWAGGIWLVPGFLGMPWGLKKPKGEMAVEISPPTKPSIFIHHHRDQNLPNLKVTAETSFFWIKVSQFFVWVGGIVWNIGVWLFLEWRFGPARFLYKRVGIRIIIFVWFAGGLVNTWDFVWNVTHPNFWAKPIKTLPDKTPLYSPMPGQCVQTPRYESVGIFINYPIKSTTYRNKMPVLVKVGDNNKNTIITWSELIEVSRGIGVEPFPQTLTTITPSSKIPIFPSKVCF
jgi:hypothetical protein